MNLKMEQQKLHKMKHRGKILESKLKTELVSCGMTSGDQIHMQLGSLKRRWWGEKRQKKIFDEIMLNKHQI